MAKAKKQTRTTISKPVTKTAIKSALKKLGVKLPHGYATAKRKAK
jgi:hypothetical protein